MEEFYRYSRCGLIRVLLSFGADRNLKDVNGNSPAHIAAQREDWDELRLLITDNWKDSCNLNGLTVQEILKRKLARNCTNRSTVERFHVIVQELQGLMEALRNGKSVNVDVVDTLNEKCPEAFRIIGFENIMAYPLPRVRTLHVKDILFTPEKKILITNILQLFIEKEAPINQSQARILEDDKTGVLVNRKCEPSDTLEFLPSSLWKLGSSLPLAVFADPLVWKYVRKKHSNLFLENYIPPAPDAIKHLIRDLPNACKENTVGEFHFDVQCSHERCEIGRQVRALVTDLVHIMEKLDPRFQSKLYLTGSVPEKTKLWKPDEFDFMVELTKLKGHCKIRYVDGRPGSRETMVVLDQEAKEMWKDLTTSNSFESNDFLSPTYFRDYFVLLAWRSGFSLNRAKYKNLSFRLGQYYGQQDGHPLVTFSGVGALLHMQWHGRDFTSLDVNEDLTPSLHFSEAPEDTNDSFSSLYDQGIGYHAITAIKKRGAFWRLSFSLTELSLIHKLSTTQLELYKALKLLRDIHMEEGATSSYALKSIVFNYVFKENSLWDPQQPDELAFHVVSLLRRLQRRPHTNDEIVRSFFTVDMVDDTETWNISTDWIRLSLLEFRKERIPSWFWLNGRDQTSYT